VPVASRTEPDWTPKQLELLNLLSDPDVWAVLAYGGSRSGKTRAICEWMVRVALYYPGIRMLAARFRRIDAQTSLWRETLLDEVLNSYPSTLYKLNRSDLRIEFGNGSEIWVDGMQERERVERILGRGLALIFLNEGSQIAYEAYTYARTRMSQLIPGWSHKIIVDENPPGPQHWTHRIFIDHLEPRDRRPLDPDRYRSLKINPTDNPHLPPQYLEQLADMPADDRARFLEGLFRAPAGAIYGRLLTDATWVTEVPGCEKYVVGVDLITYRGVLVGMRRVRQNDKPEWQVWCIDEIVMPPGAIARELDAAMHEAWYESYRYHAYIDHNLGEGGTREIRQSSLANKGAGSVEAGIATLQGVMERGLFHVHVNCATLRYEVENYRRDENQQIIKEDDHLCDALRYAVHSSTQVRRFRLA